MNIVGHQQQWNFLKGMITNNKIPHALLFSGPDYLGKSKMALEFVKLLNCENPANVPCKQCFFCLNLEKQSFPDFLLIEPISKEIKIDQMRDLQKFLSYARQLAKFKAVIIDQAHLLNQEAQNCLLKTLEEPKENTILFLITSLPQALFKTILSRCEQLKFYPVDSSEMAKNLASFKENEKWQDILVWSEGRPGLAIRFFQEKDLVKQHLANLWLIENLLKSDLAERLLLIKDYWNSVAGNGKNISDEEDDNSLQALSSFLGAGIFYLRQLLRQKINSCDDSGNSTNRVMKILKKIEDLKILLLNTNINKRLLLENLALVCEGEAQAITSA